MFPAADRLLRGRIVGAQKKKKKKKKAAAEGYWRRRTMDGDLRGKISDGNLRGNFDDGNQSGGGRLCSRGYGFGSTSLLLDSG